MLRKMIKWKPFYALPGQENIIKELLNEKEKQERPTILNSEEVDFNLRNALENNSSVNIKYFDYGFIKNIVGKISSVDKINKYLVINGKRIYFKNILRIM